MSRKMEEIRDMLCEELDRIADQRELTAGSLDTIDKLTHSIKSIDTIMAMEDSGYSNDYMNGRTYNGGNSYRGRNRDSMGRYSRRYNRGYSYDDAKDDMVDQLEEIMHSAQDEESKKIIQKAIDKLEK